MAQKIYTSPLPSFPTPNCSLYTHLLGSTDEKTVGGLSASLPAFIDAHTGTILTRGQLRNVSLSFGHGILNQPNVPLARGDVVLIYSQNSLAYPVVLFGSMAAGLRCTLANSAYTPHELAFQYKDSKAKLVFASEDSVKVVFQMFEELGLGATEARKRVIVIGKCLEWAGGPAVTIKSELASFYQFKELLTKGSLKKEANFDGDLAQETAYLCYSSGTTGKPKGVETTHKNITSVVTGVREVFHVLSPSDRLIGFLPMYHIYGAINLLHFPLCCGVPVLIMSRFDPIQFCEFVQQYKITVVFLVPPVMVMLSRHPAVDKYDLSSLKILFSGAAPLGAALTKQVNDRLLSKRKQQTPLTVAQGYGLTETSPTTHLVPLEKSASKIGSVGVLLPNLEARLVVDGDGNGEVDAEEGQAGELWLRGYVVMKGYFNNPKATNEAITPDKWFKTGDIATRDSDGFYYIVDRRKELIKYKGFQVPPAELESVLLTHPEIADVAIIGVDSVKEATELPRAYIVPSQTKHFKTEGEKTTFARDIQQWIQTKVARHKFLRGGVVVIDMIPKSAAGKILRRELRERAKKELAGRDPADDILTSKL